MATVRSLGLGKTMETKLHLVGIHSAEELIEIDVCVGDNYGKMV